MLAAISYHPIVHVHLGPLSISPHGVGIAVGFVLGARLFVRAIARHGVSEDTAYALVTRAAIGAMVGARLAYVLNHPADYGSPLEVLQVWKGGISLLGGFIGAILLGLPKIRAERLSFWKVMDAAAPAMALGVVIGRIGDLVVADHLGKTTDFFLGYRCPPLDVDTASPCAPTALAVRTPGAVVHQTALYDLVSATALLTVLLRLRRRPHYDGFVILVFATWYGAVRIIEDFLREDVRRLGLTGSQWTSVVAVSLCLFVLLVRRRTPRWGRWDTIAAGPTHPSPAGEDDDGGEGREPEPPDVEGGESRGDPRRGDVHPQGDRDRPG